jgi:hypothetical protein
MTVRHLATGEASSAVDEIRTETFRGREYTVVPVVALVEGVIQGLNAEFPEFAPASEFGKFVSGWNGRPVTMNHPRNAQGELSSANIPILLEEYQMGFTANSTLEDTRLKMEAWIDNELVAEKGAEFEGTLSRLNSGEDLVEVSTGLFCEVVAEKGMHNNQAYEGVWQNVVPDHLAMLSEGTRGACSVEDGCGAPRLNQLRIHSTDKVTTIGTVNPVNLGAPSACCDACAQTGGHCMDIATNEGESAPTTPPSPTTQPSTPTPPAASPTDPSPPAQPTTPAPKPAANEGDPKPGDDAADPLDPPDQDHEGEGGTEHPDGPGDPSNPGDPETVEATIESNQMAAQTLDRLVSNAVDPSITLENARDLLQKALRAEMDGQYPYVLAYTSDQVAFEMYTDDGYQNMARNYSIDANGGVTFTGEPVPVNLLLRIVPRDNGQRSNEDVSGANQQQEGTADMSGENQQNAQPETDGDVQVNANGAETSPAPRTLEEALNGMPDEMAEVIREGVELRTQKRKSLVSSIVANSNGQYTEDLLANTTRYPMDELERINTLCAPKPDYSGRPFPSARMHEGVVANGAEESQLTVPEPPKAFGRKESQSGGGVNQRSEDAQ